MIARRLCEGARMSQTTRTIRSEFNAANHHSQQLVAGDELRAAYSTLLDTLERTTPPGRERALAVTKLQESCMWAIRGISVGEQPKVGAPR